MDCKNCAFGGCETKTCNNECGKYNNYNETYTETRTYTDEERKIIDEHNKGKCYILFGEKNNGKRHMLSKLAINYILDREYEKAKQVLDELMEV